MHWDQKKGWTQFIAKVAPGRVWLEVLGFPVRPKRFLPQSNC
jgi:hypothetical protein